MLCTYTRGVRCQKSSTCVACYMRGVWFWKPSLVCALKDILSYRYRRVIFSLLPLGRRKKITPPS